MEILMGVGYARFWLHNPLAQFWVRHRGVRAGGIVMEMAIALLAASMLPLRVSTISLEL